MIMAGEKKEKTEKKTAGKIAEAGKKGKAGSAAGGKPAGKSSGAGIKPSRTKASSLAGKRKRPVQLKPDTVTVKPLKTADPAPKAHRQVFIKKIEKTLLDTKSEIMNNLITNNNDFQEIVEGLDPKDLADIASDDIDKKMIEALGSQELKRLNNTNSALSRIREGKYGICIKCGKLIPQERLEAIPYALMCIDCKSEEERRNR